MEWTLPDYKSQTSEVRARFDALKARPVMLDVQGLGKVFASPKKSETVLQNVSFQVHRREFLSIIGPSGCGKSTLIRIVAGLEQSSEGTVTLENTLVEAPGPERGMVFQNYSLFPWQTVLGNVRFPLVLQGHGVSIAEAEARTWIDIVGLANYEDYYPSQLSGGMRQRVAIARALAAKPKVLLMDEPFGALDAQTRSKMQAYLLEIWRKVDVTILFITHDLDEAVFLSDRILVLKAHPGEVQELIEVPLPQPRDKASTLTPEFLAVRQRLEELIHPQNDDNADKFEMLRLAPANSEVL